MAMRDGIHKDEYQRTEEYQLGRRDRSLMRPFLNCPYTRYTTQWLLWRAGYIDELNTEEMLRKK